MFQSGTQKSVKIGFSTKEASEEMWGGLEKGSKFMDNFKSREFYNECIKKDRRNDNGALGSTAVRVFFLYR